MIEPSSIDLTALPSVGLRDRRNLPSISCIYFAIDSQGVIQYIGRTVNLQQRWAGHHRYNELCLLPGVKLVYLQIDTPELLPQIEEALIGWFQPLLNRKQVVNSEDFFKKPKAATKAHGQLKTPRQFTITDGTSDLLDEIAASVNLSRSEFIERSIQWLHSHWDGQLKREIGYKAEEG